MGIIGNLRKQWKLQKLMKRISKPDRRDLVDSLFSPPDPDDAAAENELLDFVCEDPGTGEILAHYHTSREELEQHYQHLKALGLGIWLGGSYVAVASIAVKPVLFYLLNSVNASLPDGWTEQDRWIKIVADITDYFKHNRLGPVSRE